MAWTLEQALPLIIAIEARCPAHGCHVGLTGGILYKGGSRKDLDLLFYRIRQSPFIDRNGLHNALTELGVTVVKKYGWLWKAKYEGNSIDIMFPDTPADPGQDYIKPPETL